MLKIIKLKGRLEEIEIKDGIIYTTQTNNGLVLTFYFFPNFKNNKTQKNNPFQKSEKKFILPTLFRWQIRHVTGWYQKRGLENHPV